MNPKGEGGGGLHSPTSLRNHKRRNGFTSKQIFERNKVSVSMHFYPSAVWDHQMSLHENLGSSDVSLRESSPSKCTLRTPQPWTSHFNVVLGNFVERIVNTCHYPHRKSKQVSGPFAPFFLTISSRMAVKSACCLIFSQPTVPLPKCMCTRTYRTHAHAYLLRDSARASRRL